MSGRPLVALCLALGIAAPPPAAEPPSWKDEFGRAVERARDGALRAAALEFERLARGGSTDAAWRAAFNAAWCRWQHAEELAVRGADAALVVAELRRSRALLIESLREHQEPWLQESLEAVGGRLRGLQEQGAPQGGSSTSASSATTPTGAATSQQGGGDSNSPAGPLVDTGMGAAARQEGVPRTVLEIQTVLDEILAGQRRRDAARRLPRSATGATAW